ncbi:MAG: hypothetical protein OXG11_04885 [Chloroflexi bacterium]|nr:hypothetical protein [Chloroflexota bacterium]
MSEQDALDRLSGKVIALESIVTTLLGDYVSRNPHMVAVLATVLHDLAFNRRTAEHFTDGEIQGFRETLEDFVDRISVGGQ